MMQASLVSHFRTTGPSLKYKNTEYFTKITYVYSVLKWHS